MSTIPFQTISAGILVDPDTIVFSDPTGTYGIKRNDTDAVVVADGVALTRVSLGNYEYTFTDPAAALIYDYSIAWTYLSETVTVSASFAGPASFGDDLYTLMPRLQVLIPSVSEVMLKLQLRESARDFCNRTWAFREKITMPTVVAQTSYTLVPGYTADMVQIVGLIIDTSQSVRYTSTGLNNITLADAPAKVVNFIAECILRPRASNTLFPTDFLALYDQAIIVGCLHRLQAMAGKPWSSPEDAELNRRMFVRLCGDAKKDNMLRRTGSEKSVPIPKTAQFDSRTVV